jgi:chromosome partitioning protein
MKQHTYKPLEAARMLGLSKSSLLEYERDGKIPAPRRDELNNRYYTQDDIESIRKSLGIRPSLANPPVVLAVFNMKGGVGKSTVSSNLAWKMAESGFRTLAVDADPQGHMTTALGQEPTSFDLTLLQVVIPDAKKQTAAVADVRCEITPNLHLVPANLSMWALNQQLFQQPEREYRLRRTVEALREDGFYDLVVIDSPPSYDLTSLNILLACDFLLAPVKLDGNSFYGLQYLFDSIRDIAKTYRYSIPKVAIVANYFNGSFSVSRQILEGLKSNYGPYLTRTLIRQDVSMDKANALRSPVFVAVPSSKASKDLEDLAAEMIQLMQEKGS